MRVCILVAVFFFCIVLASCRYDGNKQDEHHSKNNVQKAPVCQYKDFDLRLTDKSALDYVYFNLDSRSTFYLRPCSSVSNSECNNASICEVNANGKGVSFGYFNSSLWTDGVENNATLEVTYGSGEMCSTGVPRKAIVEYRCSLSQNIISSAEIGVDGCYVKFIVDSMYACPVANYCRSITDEYTCDDQDDLCSWASGKCGKASTGCGRLATQKSAAFAVMILICLGALLACILGLVICACKTRKMRRAKNRVVTAGERTNKRRKDRASGKKEKAEVEYQLPYQQVPLQLIPGGFVPINPYSLQGIPMTQFAGNTEGGADV